MNRDEKEDGFLSRWSRLKSQARQASAAAAEPVPEVPATPEVASAEATPPAVAEQGAPTAPQQAAPAPTLADVAQLTPQSDFTRFVAPGVQADVKNAALKKLFADPHFNAMDGLDVYIDDYGRPDPIPAAMLAKLAQTKFLDLISAAPPPAAGAGAQLDAESQMPESASGPATVTTPSLPHENADLQLQPDDAARCAEAQPGSGEDAGREQRRPG